MFLLCVAWWRTAVLIGFGCGGRAMIIPEYQSYALTTTGHGYYRVPTADAPRTNEFVQVDGKECRVLIVRHEGDGWSKVCVTTDRRSLT